MNAQNVCRYRKTYVDVQAGKTSDYRCPRPRHRNYDSCIFHSEECHCEGHTDEMRQVFKTEIAADPSKSGNPVQFIGCNIPAVDVKELQTERSLHFVDAKFLGDVEFANVKCGEIDFTEAEFAGQVRITATRADALRFRKSRAIVRHNPHQIDEKDVTDVTISRCSFGSYDAALSSMTIVRLCECDIDGGARFRGARFQEVLIQDCVFGGNVDFSACKFHSAEFVTTTFGSAATFEHAAFHEAGRFRQVNFQNQALVRFDPAMANVSFLHTDITRIKFSSDTAWNDASDPYRILDERELTKESPESSLSAALAVYRNLRECYEYWMMYTEAGQFYAKEMDLRRRCPNGSRAGRFAPMRIWLRRYLSLSNGYNVLCGYGESFGKASAWLVGLFVASTVYFAFTSHSTNYVHGNPYLQIVAALERTLSAFLYSGKGGIGDHVVRIMSLPVLGSMFLVLKRRLERKFRH